MSIIFNDISIILRWLTQSGINKRRLITPKIKLIRKKKLFPRMQRQRFLVLYTKEISVILWWFEYLHFMVRNTSNYMQFTSEFCAYMKSYFQLMLYILNLTSVFYSSLIYKYMYLLFYWKSVKSSFVWFRLRLITKEIMCAIYFEQCYNYREN